MIDDFRGSDSPTTEARRQLVNLVHFEPLALNENTSAEESITDIMGQ